MSMKTRISEQGFTLVEVMVTAAVMSVGLLGLAALQSTGLRGQDNAYARSQATILAGEVVDRMRANRTAAQTNGSYDIALAAAAPAPGNCTGATCTPDQMATYDVGTWLTAVAAALPNGDGAIACGPPNAVCTVTVQWQQGSNPAQQLTLTTQL